MRNMFGSVIYQGGEKGMITNKVWCKLNKEFDYYEEMSEKELKAFFDMYSKTRETAKGIELEVFSDY